MGKIQLALLLMILLLPTILAVEPAFIFEKNKAVNLCIPTFNENNSEATSGTTCFLTLKNSQMDILINDKIMEFNSSGLFCYNISSELFNELGEHPTTKRCNTTVDNSFSTFVILITETGSTQDTSEAIGSFGFLIMIIAITILLGIIGFKLCETENLWILGIFFLFLMLLFLVFDIYLGYEYRLNYTGANNDSSVIEILFYSFLFLFTTGVGITIVLLFRKWHKIIDWFKAALKNDAEPDDDYFSGQDDFR